MKNLVLLVSASVFLVTGCGNKKDDDGPRNQAQGTATVQDKVAAASWCVVDDLSEFKNAQVVKRISFGAQNAQMDFLRVTNNSAPVVHKLNDRLTWKVADGGPSASDQFSVELVEDAVRIAKLDGLDKQQKIYEQVLTKNPHLEISGSNFSPRVALAVKVWSDGSGISETNFFPCSAYTKSFDAQSPVRPMIEYQLFLTSITSERSHRDFGRAMAFASPIDEIRIDQIQLENTQWCAWLPLRSDRLHLRTVTVGHGKFLEQDHVDVFDAYERDETEERKLEYLRGVASGSSVFNMENVNGRISGQSVDDQGGYPLKRLYTLVQDAMGVRALVKVSARSPELSFIYPDHIYYDCADARPLEFSVGFKKNIKTVLDLQLEQLKK